MKFRIIEATVLQSKDLYPYEIMNNGQLIFRGKNRQNCILFCNVYRREESASDPSRSLADPELQQITRGVTKDVSLLADELSTTGMERENDENRKSVDETAPYLH